MAVYAQPRASRTAVVGGHDGMVKIALQAPPVDGKANAELIRFLARLTRVPKRAVRVIGGAASRRKRVLIEGATVEMLSDCLAS
ncbi:MAG: DUF167 domain-containing protein [Myxococcota bacterium]|nr:DUF167 domain-containing protein [Myxococcota bacterium]